MVDIENDIETLVESTCHFLVGKRQLMNGRCETNPLDQATNVCGTCYGDFCDICLVTLKGRKHPTCKECALIVSGVKGSAKPEIRGSRRTAKERRETYKSLPAEERVFEYFDSAMGLEASDHQPDEASSDEEKKKSKRKKLSATSDSTPNTDEELAAEDAEDNESENRSKKKSIGKRKKKAADPVIDTSSELARLENLSDNLVTADDSGSGDDAHKSKSRPKSRNDKRRNNRSHSAINKLEEIQSATPVPQPTQGRLVPPRKTAAETPLDATVPHPAPQNPQDQSQSNTIDLPSNGKNPPAPAPEPAPAPQPAPAPVPASERTIDPEPSPTDLSEPAPAAESETDSAVDHDNDKSLSTERPSSRPRKPRKTWPTTASQSSTEDSERPSGRPRWPGTKTEETSTADSEAKAATEAPISGPAIFDKLTNANPTFSAKAKSDSSTPPSPSIGDDNEFVDQASPTKSEQESSETDVSTELAANELATDEPTSTAVAPAEPAVTDVAPTAVAPADVSAELQPPSLSDDPFASTRDVQSEEFLVESQPPPPSPTQVRGSAENMPIVGSMPSGDDSPTSEFKNWSTVSETSSDATTENAPAKASITSDSPDQTWDPNATPWDSSSDSWDESAQFDDSESQLAFDPEPLSPSAGMQRDDKEEVEIGQAENINAQARFATETEASTPVITPVDALMFGADASEPAMTSRTSTIEADTDLTKELSPVDSSEIDAAGNWIPPALRGIETRRRDDE